MMRDFVDDNVRARMETRARRLGGRCLAAAPSARCRSWSIPARLAERGLTLTDVRSGAPQPQPRRLRRRDRERQAALPAAHHRPLRRLSRTWKSLILARRGDTIIRLTDVARRAAGSLRDPPARHLSNGAPSHQPVGAPRGRLQRHRHQGGDDDGGRKPSIARCWSRRAWSWHLTADDVRYVQASIRNVWTQPGHRRAAGNGGDVPVPALGAGHRWSA